MGVKRSSLLGLWLTVPKQTLMLFVRYLDLVIRVFP